MEIGECFWGWAFLERVFWFLEVVICVFRDGGILGGSREFLY